MVKISNRGFHNCREESEVAITLLPVTPLAKSEVKTASDSDGMGATVDGKATSFDADTHAAHFDDVFRFYDVDIRE